MNEIMPAAPRAVAKVKQFELGEQYAPWWKQYLEAKKIVDTYKDRFKEIFDDADEITLLGEVVATNKVDGKFAVKRFRDENPHIADQYLTTKQVEVFDEEKFKEIHKGLWEQYRSRSLRIK